MGLDVGAKLDRKTEIDTMYQLYFHVDTARRMQFKNGWNATAIEMARSHRIESKCAWTSVPNWIEKQRQTHDQLAIVQS